MPDTHDETTPAPATLGEFLASQQSDATGDAVARLLGYLASRGGHAHEGDVRRAGHGDAAMLAALSDHPTDKRIKARARAAVVHGATVLWLTTPGWKAVGSPSKRETRPTTQTLAHADAPRRIAEWLAPIAARVGDGLTCTLTTDPATLSDLSETAKALAWTRIQDPGSLDHTGGAGLLTAGFRPDALVIERWWSPELHQAAYELPGSEAAEVVAEQLTVIEVEDTTKATGSLRAKVLRLDAAIALGVIDRVVWVVRTRAVARALTPYGIGRDEQPRPGHYALQGWQAGLPGGDGFAAPQGPAWWPTRLDVATPPPTARPFSGSA